MAPRMQKIDPNKTQPRTKKVISITPIVVGVYIVLIGLGVGTGYLLSTPKATNQTPGQTAVTTEGGKTVYGSSDTKTFSDSAIGVIQKDGIDGEGTHSLIRDGGPSQTACLVSSVMDLSQFIGKKVKVWGKTNAAQVCPWFMDVGRVELQ